MSTFWQGRRVLVTGGSGFIGSHVVELLVSLGAEVTATDFETPGSPGLENLRSASDRIATVQVDLTRPDACVAICEEKDVVINAAHLDGSVAFKRTRPAFIYQQNMRITLNMLEAACNNEVDRFLVMSSAEVYPPEADSPTPESEGLMGLPDPVTDGYAWSKRGSELAGTFFAREYGLKVAIARPSNVYGPRDYLDPKRGRVIPMFIRRILEDEPSLQIWGTGEQVRTFLYVKDLARGLLELVEKHPECDPVNLCGTEEITIRGLAELIVRMSGREAQISCDPEKPGGPERRTCNADKASRILGFAPSVPLEQGLVETIAYFREKIACL